VRGGELPAGGGELVPGVFQVATGGGERGGCLCAEPDEGAEPLVQVVVDAGQVTEEVAFVGVGAGPAVPGGVGGGAAGADRGGAADQPAQRLWVQAGVPGRAQAGQGVVARLVQVGELAGRASSCRS
jgi:hypothetical protein